MTWTPSRPANNEKISDMGQTVFRPFWDAIQTASDGVAADQKLLQWGINLIDRASPPVTGPNDPARIETIAGDVAGVVYCKTLMGSGLELFFMNSHDPANVIQLTKGAPIIGAIGETFIPGGVLIKWGFRVGTGVQAITYVTEGLTDFPSTTLAVFLSPVRVVGGAGSADVVGGSLTNTGFSFRLLSGQSTFWLALGN